MMLDESRHFFGKDVVKKHLDVMAALKLNRFHWHLTDEPGWRIEIKKYPKLTTVGGKGNWSNSKAPVAFYTQDDIREIVEYARQRHIMVIPEIDMPGHANAATRAYPEVSGGGQGRWKGFTFNPAKDETYRFIEDVLGEVAALFPGPYIHIGADEVSYGNQSWKTDPQILKFIADNNLKDSVGLEHYFVRRVAGIIHKLGKTMVGWDEIVAAKVPADQAVVMWWRHDKPGILSDALAKGYSVVLTPRHPCYFDFVQHDSHRCGRRWSGFNNLERVYDFPASIQDRLAGHEKQVLGLQASVWTERIDTPHRLSFMLYPRLAAIAEDGWTQPAQKDTAEFVKRVRVAFLPWLQSLSLSYFNPFAPGNTPEPIGPNKADPLANG
jgi:hexosaminidase